jgi:class 3 adenylate cyclase/predicted negative regulator of RcsB-dependent stress response
VQVCSACGGESPEAFRHCGFCGASLAASAVERRKIATLVFCDLSGSTAMGERVDAESVRELMRSYFDEMRVALERHGGTVEKFIGDAVVAAFGVPEAHEDDALRACRAALEMQVRIAVLNEEFERRFGGQIAVRIGLNTGEVIAGDPSSRETFVTGDAVNVAARLEQAAGPGEVLLGESTYRLVRDAVRIEAVKPLSAKGKSQPVQAYRLLEVSVFGPVPRRMGTPLAGRDDQLRLLERELDEAVAERCCRLITVVGEPGVGKSRLAAELVSRIGTRARVVRGGCLSYGEGITYWPIGQIVRALAGIHDEHSPEEALSLIQAHVEGVPNGHVVAAKLAQVLGLAEGSTTTSETAWAIRLFLAARPGEPPLVVLVDDIHWAEPTLLDLLAGLPAAVDTVPILLVCLARPELLESCPDWKVAVRLEPLGEHEVDALLGSLLGAAPAAVLARLATASAGNPLFVEELAAMLLDDGVLRIANGVCTLVGDLDAVALPASLHALLGARLDQLAADAREALERGAIEGEVFHRGAVVELCTPALRGSVPASLKALAVKDIVRPAEATFSGEAAFRFKHILVRDAAYHATAKKLRAVLHEQFAGWLERVARERAAEYGEILGYHLEQSYRYRAELGPIDGETRALGQRAANRLAAAGRRAHARGDARAASSLFARAAELTSSPLEQAEHALRHGAAAREAGAFATAGQVLTGVRAAAVAAGWRGLEAGAEVELAMLSLTTHPLEPASRLRQIGDRALATFEALEDDRGTAVALVLLARERWLALHCADQEHLLDRALAPAERSGDQRLVAAVLIGLAQSAVFGPRPAGDAESRCENLLERAAAIGPMAAASISMMLAVLEASLGNSSRARALGSESKAVMNEVATGPAVAGAAQYAGLASLIAGDPGHAEQELRSAGELLEELGERAVASSVAALHARALVELERYEEAERVAVLGLSWANAGDVVSQAYARGALARSLAARGLMDEALQNAHQAVELSSGSDFLNQRGDALLDLALVQEAADDRPAARSSAAEALVFYRAKGNVVSEERAARLLDC